MSLTGNKYHYKCIDWYLGWYLFVHKVFDIDQEDKTINLLIKAFNDSDSEQRHTAMQLKEWEKNEKPEFPSACAKIC